MADSKKYDGSQWEHSLRKLTTATETIENPLYSDGTAITSYTIKGNTVQNGIPTPDNPVDANGVGVGTENLWDGTSIKNLQFVNGVYETATVNPRNVIYIPVIGGNTYTFSINNIAPNTSFQSVCSINKPAIGVSYFINGNTTFITHGEVTTFTRTIPNEANWWAIQIMSSNNLSNNIMINEGSTVLPYEPYGYKIPISSGGVTTNIYLGSTQTVRAIKKLVLDGTEEYGSSGTNTWLILRTSVVDFRGTTDGAICSHLPLVLRANFTTNTCAWGGGESIVFLINVDNKNTEDLKSYIAQQYAAGTPVTIWYVLATPETGIVNEPLMKIGDYADTLSNATAIPTTKGANSITVDTTVQPSEFTATWTGWHDSSVKEWDGSQWNE